VDRFLSRSNLFLRNQPGNLVDRDQTEHKSALATNSQESALVIFVVQLESQFVAVERRAFLDIAYGKHYRVNLIDHHTERTDSGYKRLTSAMSADIFLIHLTQSCSKPQPRARRCGEWAGKKAILLN
jgi:hypothetical protein